LKKKNEKKKKKKKKRKKMKKRKKNHPKLYYGIFVMDWNRIKLLKSSSCGYLCGADEIQ